jgi:hypothetical protein
MVDGGRSLRALLETLEPKARDDLRRVLIRDQADRDAYSPTQVLDLMTEGMTTRGSQPSSESASGRPAPTSRASSARCAIAPTGSCAIAPDEGKGSV